MLVLLHSLAHTSNHRHKMKWLLMKGAALPVVVPLHRHKMEKPSAVAALMEEAVAIAAGEA